MAFRPLTLEDLMPFGKHKGEQVEDLIDDDPSYLAWLYENDKCEFDADVIRLMEANKII